MVRQRQSYEILVSSHAETLIKWSEHTSDQYHLEWVLLPSFHAAIWGMPRPSPQGGPWSNLLLIDVVCQVRSGDVYQPKGSHLWKAWRQYKYPSGHIIVSSVNSPQGHCHDRDIRSPCTLLSDHVHVFTVRLLYVLPFLFLSICPVSPPIGECVVHSVSLFNYLICFLSHFRLLYIPVPVPLLIRCLLVIQLSHLPYLLSAQRDCTRRSSVIPTPRTSPHPFYLV